MSDIYYSPEEFGLKVVGEASWDDAPYSFDLTVVWIDSEGNLYWASDSGCSCPWPFDWVENIDDLSTGTKQQCLDELEEKRQQAVSRHFDPAPEDVGLDLATQILVL